MSTPEVKKPAETPPDLEVQKKARERMDARREAIRQRVGEVSIAVEAIRSLRDA